MKDQLKKLLTSTAVDKKENFKTEIKIQESDIFLLFKQFVTKKVIRRGK